MATTQSLISKDSHYATVMAIARRARQLIKEADNKGINPWEVSFAKIGAHKPIKLAEEEFEQGMLGYKLREKPPVKKTSVKIAPAEESVGDQEETTEKNETQDAKTEG